MYLRRLDNGLTTHNVERCVQNHRHTLVSDEVGGGGGGDGKYECTADNLHTTYFIITTQGKRTLTFFIYLFIYFFL